MKTTIIMICLLGLIVIAGCGPAEPETGIHVTGIVSSTYPYNTTVTIDGRSETWQFGTALILEDGRSYRILGTHEFIRGETCELKLEPFEDGWYLLK